MEEEQLEIKKEKVQEKINSLFKDKYVIMFLIIFAIGIIIRLYYFSMTSNQPLWWDEADYLAFAKNLAGYSTHWQLTGGHSSVFPYLVAFFFMFGLSEAVAKFFILIVPSILIILLTYKICLLMYPDKRIALISSFLMATFWNILFNSMRFHVGPPALLFAFLAIYVFWKGYERKEKIFGKFNPNWAIPLTVILLAVMYSIRRGYFFFGAFFLVYMFSTRKFKVLIKDKYNWIALFFGIALFFLAEATIFPQSVFEMATVYTTTEPVSLSPLQVFPAYFQQVNGSWLSPLLYLCYFGIFLIVINLFLSFGYFRKPEDPSTRKIRSDWFVFLTIALTLAYFLFYQRTSTIGDVRWYFPLLLGCLISISKGTIYIADYFKKYGKQLSVILIVVLIGFGGYYEIQHADLIIKEKLPSFQGIRDAGIYLKGVAAEDDIILTCPLPQPAYYAERQVIPPRELVNIPRNQDTTLEQTLIALKENTRVNYVIVSFSEPNFPPWMRVDNYIQNPQTGQITIASWEIPFMTTTVDFINNQQDIKQSIKYEEQGITFNLEGVFNDVFVYKIVRD